MKIQISDFDLGWLVGLLEGEGHFSFDCSQRVSIGMVDEDTINAYAMLLSKILDKEINIFSTQPTGNRQELFQVRIAGDNARKIMKLIAPYMHYRRRRKIWQCLNKYEERLAKKTKVDLKTLMGLKKTEEV